MRMYVLPLSVLSNAKVSRRSIDSRTSPNKSRPALIAPALGSSGESPRGDLVCVIKPQALHFVREEFFGKGCFARAVAAGNQINRWAWNGHLI